MEFTLQSSDFFIEQVKQLSDNSVRIVKDKLRLLKENPFRNKRIQGHNLFLFRVRFKDSRKEKRIIYLVDKPQVKLLCILDRDKEYKDLSKYLKKLGYV
jgi:mRNA-degrading endonuclease RelE of RelBE toxin-antitoxin system